MASDFFERLMKAYAAPPPRYVEPSPKPIMKPGNDRLTNVRPPGYLRVKLSPQAIVKEPSTVGDLKIPDTIRPIIGWKYLHTNGIRYESPLFKYEWTPGVENIAACRRSDGANGWFTYESNPHATPHESCNCGFHFGVTPYDACVQRYSGFSRILCAFLLTGKVIQHADGYRAEKATLVGAILDNAYGSFSQTEAGAIIRKSSNGQRMARDGLVVGNYQHEVQDQIWEAYDNGQWANRKSVADRGNSNYDGYTVYRAITGSITVTYPCNVGIGSGEGLPSDPGVRTSIKGDNCVYTGHIITQVQSNGMLSIPISISVPTCKPISLRVSLSNGSTQSFRTNVPPGCTMISSVIVHLSLGLCTAVFRSIGGKLESVACY